MTYSSRRIGLSGALDVVARTSGCSTAGIGPLDAQLIAEMLRLSNGTLVRIEHPNVKFTSDRVHPYLTAAGRDALLRAAASGEIQINSALRTIADQYLLHAGCGGAAVPGGSNHESGQAIDVKNWPARRAALLAAGFTQPIPTNSAYFEVPGSALRKLGVLAFQGLWNANHPEDRIAVDGVAATQTLARIARAPSEGFPVATAGSAPTVSASDLVSTLTFPELPTPTRYDEPSTSPGGGIGVGTYVGLGVAALVLAGIVYASRKSAAGRRRVAARPLAGMGAGDVKWMVANRKSSRRVRRNSEWARTAASLRDRLIVPAAPAAARRDMGYASFSPLPAPSKWPKPTRNRPSQKTLEDYAYDIKTPTATDGCRVEPDGICQHGHVSWLLYLGWA